MSKSLKDILVDDLKNAKSVSIENIVLEEGDYIGKLLGFTEEDTYQYVTFEIEGKRYNFFYNYFLRDSTDYNADVLNWIKALATIPVTEKTTLLEIANSAIGSSYKFSIYNYVSKSGKNAGQKQHAISFRTAPEIVTVEINEEELELPF